MSNMKMVSLIAATDRVNRADEAADILALIRSLDDMLMPMEVEISELRQRVKRLEETSNGQTAAAR